MGHPGFVAVEGEQTTATARARTTASNDGGSTYLNVGVGPLRGESAGSCVGVLAALFVGLAAVVVAAWDVAGVWGVQLVGV